MKKIIALFLMLSLAVMSYAEVEEGIRADLNYMSDEEIEGYFNECVIKDKIYFYKGGYTNMPLVDEGDMKFVSKFKTVSVGCTGGVPEAAKFNKLMLNYVRQNKISPAPKKEQFK